MYHYRFIYQNSLSGCIPHELSSCTTLQHMYLQYIVVHIWPCYLQPTRPEQPIQLNPRFFETCHTHQSVPVFAAVKWLSFSFTDMYKATIYLAPSHWETLAWTGVAPLSKSFETQLEESAQHMLQTFDSATQRQEKMSLAYTSQRQCKERKDSTWQQIRHVVLAEEDFVAPL